MFTAKTSTLAAAGLIATGAVVGVFASASASAPGPEEPSQGSGASMSETHRQGGNAGNHDHPDMEQMARMHEQMMAEHPEMARMHERMMAEHPDMARMHEQMMGGMGGGMMGGNSGMGMQ